MSFFSLVGKEFEDDTGFVMLKILQGNLIVCFVLVFSSAAIAVSTGSGRYLAYAHKLHNEKQHKMAEQILDKGILQYPGAIDLYYARAKVRADYLNKDLLAMRDYSVAIKYAPRKFYKAFWRRGDIFFQFSQYRKAIQDYTSCLKISPKYGKVYFKRAKAYLKVGMRNEAVKDLNRCVHFSPVYKKAVFAVRKKNVLW